MRSCFLIACLFFYSTTVTLAQIVSIQPDTVFINTYGNATEHGFAFINNSTSDTLHLRWHRILVSTQQAWVSSICDNNACHAITDNFGDFTISPNDTGYVELMIDPNYDAGDGMIQAEIYDPLDSINVNALAIFSIHVSEINSANVIQDEIVFKIFPNPATDFIAVQSLPNQIVNKMIVFDLSGNILINQIIKMQSPYQKSRNAQQKDKRKF